MPISVQPIFGGPAYVIRNLVVNAAVEQIKLHNATVGVVVLNNTFVSPAYAFQVLDSTTPRELFLGNNLWVGPSPPQGGRTVNWDQPMDPTTDSIDYNGYFPDGEFHFGYGTTGATYADFAAVVAGGRYEAHGRVVGAAIFASGLTPPASYTTAVTPVGGTLASGSDAIDHGTPLANVTDGYHGAAPDLGAQETGCLVPALRSAARGGRRNERGGRLRGAIQRRRGRAGRRRGPRRRCRGRRHRGQRGACDPRWLGGRGRRSSTPRRRSPGLHVGLRMRGLRGESSRLAGLDRRRRLPPRPAGRPEAQPPATTERCCVVADNDSAFGDTFPTVTARFALLVAPLDPLVSSAPARLEALGWLRNQVSRRGIPGRHRRERRERRRGPGEGRRRASRRATASSFTSAAGS